MSFPLVMTENGLGLRTHRSAETPGSSVGYGPSRVDDEGILGTLDEATDAIHDDMGFARREPGDRVGLERT
jgi:hypothetical protein